MVVLDGKIGRFAKTPSVFPIFPKCQSISENFGRSENSWVAEFSSPKFSRASNFVKSHKLSSIEFSLITKTGRGRRPADILSFLRKREFIGKGRTERKTY